jgi:hypothetical protein
MRLLLILAALLLGIRAAHGWTIYDLNPWKQVREWRIFSLTRADPIGVRVLVVPVIDDAVNAPIVTRLSSEFSNSLRSFANEVWLVTDLPDNPIKQGFYTALPQILGDYRLKNRLSFDLLRTMIPDFECDYVALFEVTAYDRFWIDEDLQHRVGVRAVFYDYQDGGPRIEKFYEGARGRRLEEGAFSEAERIAVKGLVRELELPLRKSIEEREEDLKRRYSEVQMLANRVGQRELAIHQYDLNLMRNEIQKNQEAARQAQTALRHETQEKDRWKQEAERQKSLIEKAKGKTGEEGGSLPLMPPPAAYPCPPTNGSGPGTPTSTTSAWTGMPSSNSGAVPQPAIGSSSSGGDDWVYVGPPPR